MQHVDLLVPHEEPIVVIMGPRTRNRKDDFNVLEYYVADLKMLDRPITFRVSGMITGPEEFIETIGPDHGHLVEVFGPGPDSSVDRVRRLNKNDELERDAASLIGAHALWVWVTSPDLFCCPKYQIDGEMVQIAHELGVPVLVFLPEQAEYEITLLEKPCDP